MTRLHFHYNNTAFAVLFLNAMLFSGVAQAQQTKTVEALNYVRDAMEAYSNLDLETSKAALDKAMAMAPELDKKTIARIHMSYGVLYSGGFANNAQGQQHFMRGVCLDPNVSVDPLYLTPEMETEFNLAKLQANPSACSTAAPETKPAPAVDTSDIFNVETTPAEPAITPCGEYEPPTEQKQKYEIPFHVVLDASMETKVDNLVVRYSFDDTGDYKQIELEKKDLGYGAMITCDQGQIRIFDPATIRYYIEGTNAIGELICGHGTKAEPLEILMMPDAEPMPAVAGMTPKECGACQPWDKTCGAQGKPGLAEPCQPDVGCRDELKCADSGFCEEEKKSSSQGPSTFYVEIFGGTGAGYYKKSGSLSVIEDDKIVVYPQENGFAWGGIPVRLAIGYYVIPKLSIEVTGRFDVYVASMSEPQSCWDAGGGSLEGMEGITCYPEPSNEEEGQTSVAYTADPDEGGEAIWKEEYQYAWMVNARARYKFLSAGSFAMSAFVGAGYGYFQYRVPGDDIAYFPLVGMVDIEVGPVISYFFTKNFGISVEIPIDILVADGFALNFDFALGLAFGF